MTPEQIVIESKLTKLKIKDKDKNTAKEIFSFASFDDAERYLDLATKLRKTAHSRGLDLDSYRKLENETDKIKFIQRSLHSFDKIIFTDNKEERSVINSIKDTSFSLDDFLSLSEKKRTYKNLIKENKLNFDDLMSDLKTSILEKDNRGFQISLEYQNDEIDKAVILSSANKLKRSIISKKYEFLINDETKEIFLESAKQGITKEQLRTSVAPKIAAMKSPEDFNALLGHVIGKNIDWTPEGIENKALKNGTDLIKDDNGIMYLEIDNFSDSQAFGSRMWCITRDNQFLQNYLYKDNTRIVFRLDTNLDIKEPDSYIAMLYQGDKLVEIYDKNDDVYKDEKDLFQKMKQVDIPNMSERSKHKKVMQIESMIKDPESDDVTNLTYLNLVDLKAFDILRFYDKHKDTDYYSFKNTDLYSSERNQLLLESYAKKFDSEQIEYILNSPQKESLSGQTEKTKHVLFKYAFEGCDNVEHLNYLLENFSVKEDDKNRYNQSVFNHIFSNPNKKIVKEFIDKSLNYNINLANVFSSEVNKNILEQNISLLLDYNPNFINESMESSNKRTFINICSNPNISTNTISMFLKSDSFEKEENKILQERFLNRIGRTSEKTALDQRFLDAIEQNQQKDIIKSKKRLKR